MNYNFFTHISMFTCQKNSKYYFFAILVNGYVELEVGVFYTLSYRMKEITNKCRNFMVSFVSIIKHNTE